MPRLILNVHFQNGLKYMLIKKNWKPCISHSEKEVELIKDLSLGEKPEYPEQILQPNPDHHIPFYVSNPDNSSGGPKRYHLRPRTALKEVVVNLYTLELSSWQHRGENLWQTQTPSKDENLAWCSSVIVLRHPCMRHASSGIIPRQQVELSSKSLIWNSL